MAGFLQDGLEPELVGKRQRREFDHDTRAFAGIGDRFGDALDRRRRRQARHDDRRVFDDVGHAFDDDDVGFGKLGALGSISIEADHAPPAGDQIARNRAAHNAKPDDPNRLVHECSFPTEFD